MTASVRFAVRTFYTTSRAACGRHRCRPSLRTGIAVVRTPLAASGLAVTMLLAALTHVGRREPGGVAFTVVLMLVAAFVSWGASDPMPSER